MAFVEERALGECSRACCSLARRRRGWPLLTTKAKLPKRIGGTEGRFAAPGPSSVSAWTAHPARRRAHQPVEGGGTPLAGFLHFNRMVDREPTPDLQQQKERAFQRNTNNRDPFRLTLMERMTSVAAGRRVQSGHSRL